MARKDAKLEQTRRPPADSPLRPEEWEHIHADSRAWIYRLVEHFRKNSGNSSIPPSRDSSKQKAKTNANKRRRNKSRRRPGGQKGHPGHHRPLVPPERVDKRVERHPANCRRCSRDLSNDPSNAEPRRHQIAEIPEIRPTVTEYVLHRKTCANCNTTTTAKLPDQVTESSFGPKLRALVVLLAGRYRISRRETADLCESVFGLSVSVGTIDNIIQSAKRALETPYLHVAATAKSSPVAYLDETGWRERGQKFYLWILATAFCVVFRIGRRTRSVAQELLGESYAGSAVTDRYASYRWLRDDRHQVCWSHLNRDFEALIERGGGAKRIGKDLRKVHDNLFSIWHAYKRGHIRRKTMQRRMIAVETRLGEALQRGIGCRDPAAKRLCTSLSEIEPSLFVFARIEGVEPTNNTAERGIRPAVQWRKTCFGTQSFDGSRFVERILTVAATCRLQERSMLGYLRDVFVAADSGTEIPLLLREPQAGDERHRAAG